MAIESSGPRTGQLTRLLLEAQAGDVAAEDAAARLLYDELRALAGSQRARWSGNYTLQATATLRMNPGSHRHAATWFYT